ncbi:EPS15 [Mytilus edulis]|uniref:EPS15 n=1 Tax=Mytilus edulis TaxID=6550 RepID=A0A8S3PZB6_MYTED|nr:EPS15 [Mytilus edulis]
MSNFPPLPQIAGNHALVYEAYYNQADPKGTGSIGALDAANFLKKSGLKDSVLGQIWDLSDPTGKGYLEKPGFYVALKLVALSQSNQDLNLQNLIIDAPQPNVGPVDLTPKPEPAVQNATSVPWKVSAVEKTKYDQLFDSLVPVNGLLSGDKVRPMLMNSKLPVDVLKNIWELSDVDKDGYLDRDEFCVSMHLVYRAIEKEPVPSILPIALIPPSKRKHNPVPGGVQVLPGAIPTLPGSVPVLPGVMGGRSTPTMRSDSPSMSGQWVVNAADKSRFDAMFKTADLDMDGYVTGQETRDIFVQSGVPNNVLAHIWSLCDIKGLGKLNSEQFALAMYLINLKMKGVDPPTQLTPEMIPPSMRSGTDTAAFGITDATNAGPFSHVADFSAIKELDIIQKDIEDMKREKLNLERDDLQTEADIKISNGEVQMLQKELDSNTATLCQLENQKKDAQKCLDELDEKKSDLMANVSDMKEKCEKEEKEIFNLKSQIDNQDLFMKNQEEELNKLKIELNSLRDEEKKLEQNIDGGKQQIALFAKSKQEIQQQVNQEKIKVQHLEDKLRGAQTGSRGVNGEVSGIFASQITDDNMSTQATLGSPHSTISSFSAASGLDDFKDDPFKHKDPFGGGSAGQADPFQSEDPFKESDPFKGNGFSSDPFGAEDPFKSSFGDTSTSSKSDPFGNADPFSGSFSSTSSSSSKKANDSFDPFGGSGKPSKPGSLFADADPFALKSSSPSKKSSPSPASSSKDKKKPPPRPAPPRGTSPNPIKAASAAWNDPFAGSDPFSGSGAPKATGNDAFANFADFSPGKFDDTNAWGS